MQLITSINFYISFTYELRSESQTLILLDEIEYVVVIFEKKRRKTFQASTEKGESIL
mgnify:CR=1 FL=1